MFCGVGKISPFRLEKGILFEPKVDLDRAGNSLQNMFSPLAHGTELPEHDDRTLLNRELIVRNQSIDGKVESNTQPLTIGTHPLRTVETEQLR